jgi:hypothetical protein
VVLLAGDRHFYGPLPQPALVSDGPVFFAPAKEYFCDSIANVRVDN